MTAVETFADNATTTVTAGGTDAPVAGTVETWTLASAASFPAITTGTTQCTVGDPAAPTENIRITNITGTTATVTRGVDGTTPVTHAAGFTIVTVIPAPWLNGAVQLAGDLGNTPAAPQVLTTHLASPLPVAQGGTGQATQQAAMDALAGAQTSGQFLRGNGTHVVMSGIQAADVPQLSQYNPIGLTGATTPTSYAGGTVSGHPLSGTWTQGQWVVDQTGRIYVCVTGGTPGTWRRVGADPWQFFLDDYVTGDGKQALVTVVNGNATINTTPLAAPAAATLSNTGSGGSLTAGTYQVILTYVNRWGETVGSTSASVAISGVEPLTITGPAPKGNATGWYGYVTQAGGSTYTRQQTAGSPTPVGQNLVLTANPTSSGANPPGSDSSAAQVFTSTAVDGGKNVMICGAQGTPGGPAIDTIATVVSPTQATLTNGTSTIQASAAGCAMVFSSDLRTAADPCITAAAAYGLANGYFCQVIAGASIYGLGASFFQSTVAAAGVQYNTQFRLPAGIAADRRLEFQLLGPGAENTDFQYWDTPYVDMAGATFVSYSFGPTTADPTYGQQSVIGLPTAVPATGLAAAGFANVKIVIKGIRVIQPGWSNSLSFDLTYAPAGLVRGSSYAFAPSTADAGGINPASGWINNSFWQGKIGAGLRGPANGNNDDFILESFAVHGMRYGVIDGGDHKIAGRLVTINCDIPWFLTNGVGPGGQHDLTIGQWSIENCNNGLVTDGSNGGGVPMKVNITMDGENTALAGFDVKDTGNMLTGVIRWSDVFRAAGGIANVVAPQVSGGANLEIINGSLARAVQGAPTYSLGTAFQNPWWKQMTITLAGGTVTGISIGPTSGALTSLGITSGTFRLPAGWWLDIAGSVKPTTFIAVPD